MAEPLSAVSGISSGVDWKSLVDQIITVNRRPAVAAQASIDANTKRRTALGTFQSALVGLRTSADALNSATPFTTYGVTAAGADASGRSVLTATVGTGASPGSYAVQVTQLAAAQKVTGGVGLSPTATLPAGTLKLSRPGATSPFATVSVAASDTLTTLRDKINALNTGSTPSGVQAAVVNVSATEQRLVLTAGASGSANAFTLSDDGTSGLLGAVGLDPAAADPTRRPITVAAADARFTVDGLAVTSASNTVTGVVAGVTLNLGALGTSTVSVTRQDTATTDAIKAFVDGYNKVQQAVTAGLSTSGPMAGEPMLRTIRGRLPQLVLQSAAAGAGAPDIKSLSAIGISVQRDGTLAFDASKLSALGPTRLTDVRSMLADRMKAISTFVDGYAATGVGAIDQREQALSAQNIRLQSRIDDLTSRLDKKRTSLLAQYAKFEASLGKLKAVGDSLSTQFSALSGSKN